MMMEYLAPNIDPLTRAKQSVQLLERLSGEKKTHQLDGFAAHLNQLDANISNGSQSWSNIMQTGEWDQVINNIASIQDTKFSGFDHNDNSHFFSAWGVVTVVFLEWILSCE